MKDINFLPEDVKQSMKEAPVKNNEESRSSPWSVVLVILSGILGLAVLLIPGIYLKSVEAKVDHISRSLNTAQYAEAKLAKSLMESTDAYVRLRKDIINDIDFKGYPATEVLNAVRQAIPEGCYLESLDYGNGSLKIAGSADDGLIIAEFLSNMDRLSLLSRKGKTESLSIEKANYPGRFSLEFAVGGKEGK